MSYREPLPPEAIAAHDQQRQFPEETWDAVIGPLAELMPERPWLEVGVGSGVVAEHLTARGLTVVGLDCNRSMLDAWVGRAADRPAAVSGDGVELPFRSGSFGAIVMAYVLQLIPEWHRALNEAVRVVAGDGLIALNLGSGPTGRSGVVAKFLEFLDADLPREPVGARQMHDVVAHLESLGWPLNSTTEAVAQVARSIDDMIVRLEWNPFAWPAGIDREALASAAAQTRAWARLKGPINVASPVEVRLAFLVFRQSA